MKKTEKYKFIEHTADLKIQAKGKNIEQAFINSALAMKEAILKHENIKIKEKIKKKIEVKGKDYESLLYNFLEEFLYMLDADNFMFSNIKDLSIKDGEENKYNSNTISKTRTSQILFNKLINKCNSNNKSIINHNNAGQEQVKSRLQLLNKLKNQNRTSQISLNKLNKDLTLTANISGDKASNYKLSNDVKAITYNDMSVKISRYKTEIIFVLDV